MAAVALFCLRLGCGMMAALLLLAPAQVNPRFYRTHFLTALGLACGAAGCLYQAGDVPVLLWWLLGGAALLAYAGSVVWSLEGAPAGRVLIVLETLALAAALGPAAEVATPDRHSAELWTSELSSAALLGSAVTAMLMGHSYLIAPSMSIAPLMRLLGALFVSVLVRLALAGVALWSWTEGHSLATLNTVTLWLMVRWGVGFAGPLVLGWMAWQTARIRSTQSATGILYVVVIFCFLGELTSQLLLVLTQHPL